MTFQQLTYLLEVHKAGSFSQAAKNLYITQSAISNAIIGLEKEIGSPIFIRSQYGLSLTPRGEEVITHATRICESMQFLTSPQAPKKKAVRIGCHRFQPALDAFVRLLKENQHRNDIDFSILDSSEGSFVKRVFSHEMDIAFYFKLNSYSQGLQDSLAEQGLYYEEVVQIPAVVAVGPGHPLYAQPEIRMQDLRNYRLVDSSKTGVSNARILSAYVPVNKSKVIFASGLALRQQLVKEGLAYSIHHMPPKTDRVDCFRYIPIEGLSYTFYSITNPSFPRCPEVDRFVELLKEEIVLEYNT